MARKINLEALYGLIGWLQRDHREWTTERRREFLEAFASVLDYVHPTQTTPLPVDRPYRAAPTEEETDG